MQNVFPFYELDNKVIILYYYIIYIIIIIILFLSPYLFTLFINQLLLDLNNCDAGVRIGDTLCNYMAYADDITLCSTNVQEPN